MSDPTYEIGFCYDRDIDPKFWCNKTNTGLSYVSWYLRQGKVVIETAGRKVLAREGDWVFIEPFTMKAHRFTGNSRIISMRFRAHWNDLNYFPPIRMPRIYRGPLSQLLTASAEAFCRFDSDWRACKDSLLSDTTNRTALFWTWLQWWHRAREQASDDIMLPLKGRVPKLLATLGHTADIHPVDYTKLCETVGLSRVQIDRLFKQSTGLTPKQWKEIFCLQQAEDLLASDTLSIKEIAAMLGFSDGSHFTKWFRRKMKLSPTEWTQITQRPNGSS